MSGGGTPQDSRVDLTHQETQCDWLLSFYSYCSYVVAIAVLIGRYGILKKSGSKGGSLLYPFLSYLYGIVHPKVSAGMSSSTVGFE